ncbi:MAG: septum formation initiator [Flexibacter sp. CG_4_10_14_3_um_filter_32_15]|nr:MAG: septum formation initiator [Flexibacter sp. CG_4_10_14_3_um_filter_32_15]
MTFFQRINNFYFWFFVVFILWMFFLDGNDVLNQIRMRQTLEDLKAEKEYYSKQIDLLETKKAQINDAKSLEEIAREKYLMTKEGEDVYVVE